MPNRRVLALGVASALVIVLIGLGLALASAEGTRKVAANARDLHWTNAVLGSAALARSANAQAVFFAVDHSMGVAPEQSLAQAIREAEAASEVLHDLVISSERPPPRIVALEEDLNRLMSALESVIALVRVGDVDGALRANQGDVESAYLETTELLRARRESIEDRIATTEGAAGRIAVVTSLMVTLLVPLTALVVYRSIVRRQLRERRAQMEAKLQAERELNIAKDEFIAGLSHEFRTPLTSIYGFSEVLIDSGLIDPESSIELIKLINSESSELSRMVDDLLVAARIEAGALSFKAIEMDVAEAVAAVLAPVLRSGVAIEADVEPVNVWADPLRVRQVVRNLISNAVKHGGPHIAVYGRTERNEFVCSVVDDGPGVPNEIVGQLFERFVHDGRQALLAGSVGLGLNIARSLVLEMRGDLVYERMRGTTWFTFRLPLASNAHIPALALQTGAG
jgi:signal transduction histidine kinase